MVLVLVIVLTCLYYGVKVEFGYLLGHKDRQEVQTQAGPKPLAKGHQLEVLADYPAMSFFFVC